MVASDIERSSFNYIFHSITFPFDNDCLGVVKESIQQCRGKSAVIVEDFRPVFESAVCGDNQRALLIPVADDLKKHVRSGFINWQVAQFDQDQEVGFEVFIEFVFKPAGGLCGDQ